MHRIADRAHADLNRPYEKALYLGPGVMTDAELLAVILNTGTKGESAMDISRKILSLAPGEEGLLGLCHLGIEDYKTLPGIGNVKAIRLVCIGELSKRLASRSAMRTLCFEDSDSIADYYMEQLRHEEQEKLVCVMLDTRYRFLGDTVISSGTVNASLASTRELFLAALRHRAVFIVLLHNHPSGDPTPSDEDIVVTKRVQKAGDLLEIRLMDHLIIGDHCYVSMRDAGVLDEGV